MNASPGAAAGFQASASRRRNTKGGAGQVSPRQRQVKRCERATWRSSSSIVPSGGGSDPPPEKVGNKDGGTHWREGATGQNEGLAGTTGEFLSAPTVLPTLRRIAEQARQHPARPFLTLAHLIDGDRLRKPIAGRAALAHRG